MKRREFLKSAATCAAVAAAPMLPAAKKPADAVRGKVAKGGKNGGPAVGVVVTDGLQCVRTDEKGEFGIPAREGARFVSVTVPSGYSCADFYSPIASSLKSHYFWLSPWKPSGKKGCKFVHIADSEVGGMHADKEPADAANGRFAALPVHLEDLTAGEVFHIRRDLLPAAQIEVSRAEVSPLDPGIRQDRVQPFLKLLIRVVENPCHRPPAPRRPVRKTGTCGGKNSACLVQDISLGAPLRARSRNTKNGHAERAY